MHFLLLGANGRTGQHVVSRLLSQGHTAVALVRKPESLAPRPGLTIVAGSPLSKDDVSRALIASPTKQVAATIFTLNTVRASDSPFAAQVSPARFLADSCAVACEVLSKAGARRIVVMSTAGVGDSWANTPWLSKAFLRWTNIKYALEDHGLLDKEIRLTDMEWTLVRAVRLEFDEKQPADAVKNIRTMGSTAEGMSMTDSIGVVSAAHFLVEVAIEGKYVREAVVIAN